jgi:hypothetical protein
MLFLLYQFQYHPLIYVQVFFLSFSIRASSPGQLTFFDLITLIKLSKEYKLQGDTTKSLQTLLEFTSNSETWNSFNQITRKTRSHLFTLSVPLSIPPTQLRDLQIFVMLGVMTTSLKFNLKPLNPNMVTVRTFWDRSTCNASHCWFGKTPWWLTFKMYCDV